VEVPIIKEIVIIFALSIGVLLVCHRLHLPPVVGFLLTGILCGPHGLGLVAGIDDVQNLATIGVVLLLFTVGMEFSLRNIIKYKFYFFGGGILQVFLTLLTCFVISRYLLGCSIGESVFLGFLISLSSTAIVLRILEEKRESETPHGKLILGILIFQDIIAVPMMLMVPILAGEGEEFDIAHIYNFGKGIALLALLAFAAFRGVPRLLYYVTRTKNRELFLLTVLTVCFAVAWLTSSVGLSLSLGAFLAGLVVSESEYSDEAIGNVLPFQEIFTSFFFVSMGMLLNVSFVIEQPLLILGITASVLLVKFFLAGGSALALGMPLRSAILSGMALCQVGEFSFVLAHSGMSHGLASQYEYQLFLAVSLLTMAMTPALMSMSHWLAHFAGMLPIPDIIKNGLYFSPKADEFHPLEGHIIIAGFGIRGKCLAKAAKEVQIPYVILEMNPETVRAEKLKKEPIHFGDPSHDLVLVHAGIKTAKTLAVVINDPKASMNIIKAARLLNPHVYIIARTRYIQEAEQIFRCGADEVIPDEFGSSLEIFTRVLQKHEISQEQLQKHIDDFRLESFNALRWQSHEAIEYMTLSKDPLETRIETMHIFKGSAIAGKTVVESGLKKTHGLTVLLIKRDSQIIANIEAYTQLQENDALMLMGPSENLKEVRCLFADA